MDCEGIAGRWARLGLTAAFFAALSSPVAAGAPPQPRGEGQIIESLIFSDSEAESGRFAAPAERDQFLSIDLEYGAGSDLSLLAHGDLRRSAQTSASVELGFEPTEAGVKLAFWRSADQVFSAQATAISPAAPEAVAARDLVGRTAGAEARLLYFHDWPAVWRGLFIDAETAWRWQGFEGSSQMRGDLTIGLRLGPRMQILAQSFAACTLAPRAFAAERGRPADDKLQASLVFAIGGGVSIQAGAFMTVFARRTPRDHGLVLALWRKF